jgi:hypothetical protein
LAVLNPTTVHHRAELGSANEETEKGSLESNKVVSAAQTVFIAISKYAVNAVVIMPVQTRAIIISALERTIATTVAWLHRNIY